MSSCIPQAPYCCYISMETELHLSFFRMNYCMGPVFWAQILFVCAVEGGRILSESSTQLLSPPSTQKTTYYTCYTWEGTTLLWTANEEATDTVLWKTLWRKVLPFFSHLMGAADLQPFYLTAPLSKNLEGGLRHWHPRQIQLDKLGAVHAWERNDDHRKLSHRIAHKRLTVSQTMVMLIIYSNLFRS